MTTASVRRHRQILACIDYRVCAMEGDIDHSLHASNVACVRQLGDINRTMHTSSNDGLHRSCPAHIGSAHMENDVDKCLGTSSKGFTLQTSGVCIDLATKSTIKLDLIDNYLAAINHLLPITSL